VNIDEYGPVEGCKHATATEPIPKALAEEQ